MLVLLVFFGVAVDIVVGPINSILAATTLINKLLGTVEDGGEMVVMSFICAFVFGLSVAGKYDEVQNSKPDIQQAATYSSVRRRR